MSEFLRPTEPFSLADPLIREQIARETIDRLNRAAELYIARHIIRLHYNEHGRRQAGGVSIASLLSWLNDYRRDGALQREGVITRFFRKYPERMMAIYFGDFYLFAREILQDPEFVRDRRKAGEFRESFASPEWEAWARPVLAQKFLERLYELDRLHTGYAFATIGAIRHLRRLEEQFARIEHRMAALAKGEIDAEELEAMRREFREYLQHTFAGILDAHRLSDEEARLLEQYRPQLEPVLRPDRVPAPALPP